MPGTDYKFIEELITETRRRQQSLLDDIIEATNQRTTLDRVIEETERRIAEVEELRSTPARRRLLRQLRSQVATLRTRVSALGSRIRVLTSEVWDLRRGLRSSLRNAFRGLGGIAIAGSLLDVLVNATAELIKAEIEERYNEDQENRLIDCATREVMECLGQGVRDWDPKRTADQVDGVGITPSVYLQIAWTPLRDYVHDYDLARWIKNAAHREFPKAWIRIMKAMVNDIEQVLIDSTIERSRDVVRQPCRERVWASVDECIRKRPGQPFPE